MEQAPVAPQEAAPEEGGDPIEAVGQAISALAEGIMQSGAPPEAKKAAGALMQAFEGLMASMGGGQAQPPQAGMSGGNPNAQAVG